MKKVLKLFALICLVGLMGYQSVQAHNGNEHGRNLQQLGILKGTEKDLLPDQYITREEMVAILARLSETQEEDEKIILPEKESFHDVPKNHWAFKYVELAFQKQWTMGINNHKFGVGEKLNYNQVSLFLVRSLGIDTIKEGIGYATAGAQIAEKFKIMSQSDIRGTDYVTRGEVFALVAKTLMSKTPSGELKIDKLKLEEEKVKEFKQNFPTAKEYVYNRTVRVEDGQIYHQFMPTYTLSKEHIERLMDDDYDALAYREYQEQFHGLNEFYKKYIAGSTITETLLKLTKIPMPCVNGKKEKKVHLKSSILIIEDNHYGGERTEMDLSFTQAGNKILMTNEVQRGNQHFTTKGIVTHMYQYGKPSQNVHVFGIHGHEFSPSPKDGSEEISDFYVVFSIDMNGNLQEVIGHTAFGTGYFKAN